MRKIKLLAKKIDEYISWYFVIILLPFIKREKSDAILLVPAADLNGGFGEDIMITSFIENFAKGKQVNVLTRNKIIRNDYLGNYKAVNYIENFRERSYLYLLYIIKKHSIVYIIGADIMDGTYGYYLSIDRLRMLEIANKIGVKTCLSGFSVSNDILPEVKKRLLSVSAHTIIKSRDIDSYNRLKNFISLDKLLLTNDIAFLGPNIPASYEDMDYRLYLKWCSNAKKSSLVIGFCPNSIQAKKMGLELYIKDSIFLIEEFMKHRKFSIVFLYHDLRPLCGIETDKTISEKLFNHFRANNFDCFFPQTISNGVAIKGYLSQVDFTVTGRMHLGISGITSFKPMFGVSYANKFEGMVRLFNIDPVNCLVEYTKMRNSSDVVGLFIREFNNIGNKIKIGLDYVKKETLKNYE